MDGGSHDETKAIAQPYADQVLDSPPGRARQMNRGAGMASGDVLLFLHADTFLPDTAMDDICESLEQQNAVWGRFDVKLTGRHPVFRIIETLMNWRSCLTGIATGDQAVFVKREIFEAVDGYPRIALMEDIALSKRLKAYSRPLCVRARLTTSSRRWEQKGIYRTILLMWWLRFRYFMGTSPEHLADLYRGER